MPLPLSINPEDVYSDVTARARAYADLSVRLAGTGDGYGACLSMVGADMCRIQALLWQRALVVSPNPDGQYAAVLVAIDHGLMGWAANEEQQPSDCREVLSGVRAALRGSFDQSVWTMLEPRLTSLDHLTGLPIPGGSIIIERRARLLGEDDFDAASSARQAVARDRVSVAQAMSQAGRTDDAVAGIYHADLSSFEAHIIAMSNASGDRYLACAEAVWLLSCEAVARIASLPPEMEGAAHVIRATLSAAVGVVDSQRLGLRFVPLTSSLP